MLQPRLSLIDALRGLAVAQMVVYHFIYDLSYFGWTHQVMTQQPGWIAWRTAIVTQFLLLVGISCVLRATRRPGAGLFWHRWAQIAAAAALVSAGSFLVFGPRLIWFGILHFVAVALLLVQPLANRGHAAWRPAAIGALAALAALATLAGVLLQSRAFDSAARSWLGFASQRPATEDFVPIFPWIGVVLAGIAAGQAWRRRGFALAAGMPPMLREPPRWLTWLGSWALSTYLVHQPLMMGILWSIKRLIG
jgi:uncharacterized membrane protein